MMLRFIASFFGLILLFVFAFLLNENVDSDKMIIILYITGVSAGMLTGKSFSEY